MLQLLLFGCIVFPLIAAVAVALDKEGTLRRRIVYAGTGITALSALGLALYGSFVLPISPDSSLQPLMTVLDLALLVFILYVAVNIRHRLSMGLALLEISPWLDVILLLGLCSLFWHTSITGMVVLLVLTYALEIVVDNVCARMTWGWMLKHAFGITLGLAIFNILWLYVR